MSITDSISRFASYYSRHGFAATARRLHLQLNRAVFSGRMVVFYCDLSKETATLQMPASTAVERICTFDQLGTDYLHEMTSFWNPRQALRNIEERFSKGASLWLITSAGQFAGFGWTIQGKPIAPYYFPMGAQDVQLFDFYVVPKFRGRAMHWLLTTYILRTLAAEGGARAFADTGEWNDAQRAAFKMTAFRPLGLVRTFTVFGRMFTSWSGDQALQEPKKQPAPPRNALAVARPHEQ